MLQICEICISEYVVFLGTAPCPLVNRYRRFEGACFVHTQGPSVKNRTFNWWTLKMKVTLAWERSKRFLLTRYNTTKTWLFICKFIIIIIIFLRGLGRLTCSGIDALLSFPGASTVSSSSRFVVEGVFRESGVVHSFKVVGPVLFVFESHVLYSRNL